MHHPTDRIVHTTDFVTAVVEHWLGRESKPRSIFNELNVCGDRQIDGFVCADDILPVCCNEKLQFYTSSLSLCLLMESFLQNANKTKSPLLYEAASQSPRHGK